MVNENLSLSEALIISCELFNNRTGEIVDPNQKYYNFFINKLNNTIRVIVNKLGFSELIVKSGVGQLNFRWAEVPWVSIRDIRISSGPTKGIYVVYLWSKLNGLFLTINQGTEKLNEALIIEKTFDLQKRIDKPLDFKLGLDYQLGRSKRPKSYRIATIFSKRYDMDNIPSENILIDDLNRALKSYMGYADKFITKNLKEEKQIKKNISSEKIYDIEEKIKPNHNKIRDMIAEIGEFEDYITEIEYKMENMRLDVIWKKIGKGYPNIAFEVQIGGNFYEALAKLKHANDLWNSTPILVTTDDYEEKAKNLLNGSFHEIRKVVKIINWEKIIQMYNLEKDLKSIKDELNF